MEEKQNKTYDEVWGKKMASFVQHIIVRLNRMCLGVALFNYSKKSEFLLGKFTEGRRRYQTKIPFFTLKNLGLVTYCGRHHTLRIYN